MCEIAKNQRRIYRDQDPPRILDNAGLETEASSCDPDRSPFRKQQQQQQQQQQRRDETASGTIKVSRTFERDSGSSSARHNTSAGSAAGASRVENLDEERASADKAAISKVPFPSSSPSSPSGQKSKEQVTTNGVKKEEESNELLTNGREMAPEMGVPPPPPAPHMSPDGLILPRKPYNPCLISNNHKDLRRELLFNQKVGKNVLNQKSELQRALEKQRESAMRKEAERNREETYKDDPRTALQRALEQRAKQIQLTEQPQNVEPPNPLVTARAKLRPRTDSQ